MKKTMLLLTAGGLTLLGILWFGGTNVSSKQPVSEQAGKVEKAAQLFDIERFIDSLTNQLSPQQAAYVSSVQNSISRGAVKDQQEKAALELARFWGDSIHNS